MAKSTSMADSIYIVRHRYGFRLHQEPASTLLAIYRLSYQLLGDIPVTGATPRTHRAYRHSSAFYSTGTRLLNMPYLMAFT
jgi:hypothetical protein